MRCTGVFEGKAAVHHRLQLSAEDVAQHLVQLSHGSHIGAQEGKLAGEEEADIEFSLPAGGGAAGDQLASVLHGFHAFEPRGRSHVLEDNIHAGAGSNFLHLFRDALLVVIDAEVGAELKCFGQLLLIASSAARSE